MGPKSAKSAKYRVFCGYTWKTPGIPGKYPATAWVSCRFPQFCVRFCPRPALRLRETREFPNTLCFPWKFPETQSAGDPLFSFLFSGKPYTGQVTGQRALAPGVRVRRGITRLGGIVPCTGLPLNCRTHPLPRPWGGARSQGHGWPRVPGFPLTAGRCPLLGASNTSTRS